LLWLEAYLAHSFLHCEVVFSSNLMGRIAMGEDRFEHVPSSDDLSGEVALTDLAGPLAEISDILVKLEASGAHKDHPGVYSMSKILHLLHLTYIATVQDI